MEEEQGMKYKLIAIILIILSFLSGMSFRESPIEERDDVPILVTYSIRSDLNYMEYIELWYEQTNEEAPSQLCYTDRKRQKVLYNLGQREDIFLWYIRVVEAGPSNTWIGNLEVNITLGRKRVIKFATIVDNWNGAPVVRTHLVRRLTVTSHHAVEFYIFGFGDPACSACVTVRSMSNTRTNNHEKFRTRVPSLSRIEEEVQMETFILLADDDFSRWINWR